MSPQVTISQLLQRYLKCIDIKISRHTLRKKVELHPLKNSIRCLSDVLDEFHIPHVVVELTPEQLKEVKTPYVVVLNTTKTPFGLVERIDEKKVRMYLPGSGYHSFSLERFFRKWKGIVLTAEKQESSYREKGLEFFIGQIRDGFNRHLTLWTGIFILVLLGTVWLEKSPHPLTTDILSGIKIAGLILSGVIIHKTLFDSPFRDKFCRFGKRGDGKTILHPKAANIAGEISRGEMAFSYFLSTLLWGNLGAASPQTLWTLCSLLALPFLLFSLIGQARQRKGCSLCMGIDLLILTELSIEYTGTSFSFSSITLPDFLSWSALFGIILLGNISYRKWVSDRKRLHQLEEKNERLLTEKGLFGQLLKKSPALADCLTYSPLSNGLNSENYLTVVFNPACPQCVRIHYSLHRLKGYKIYLVFSVNPGDKQSEYIAKKFISIQLKAGWRRLSKSMAEWYETGKISAITPILPQAEDILLRHREYCRQIHLPGTPFLGINGHIFPSLYEIEDIEVLL